jgi:tRNA pseudouridine38-40 synthase
MLVGLGIALGIGLGILAGATAATFITGMLYGLQPKDPLTFAAAAVILGDHCFRGFAVKGTAPETDDHHCIVMRSSWVERSGGLDLVITANRFLHHMVRFLVGTMLDVASGRRDIGVITRLLDSEDNHEVSPPAPPYGLYLERVEYPRELYLVTA